MTKSGMRNALVMGIVAVVFSLPQVAHAQRLGGGAKVGVNFADVPQLAKDFKDEGGVDLENRRGLVVAGFVAVRLGGWIEFQPELLYAQKGMQGRDPLYPPDEVFKAQLDYVDIPLLVRVKTPSGRGVYAVAGPSINLNVRARVKDESSPCRNQACADIDIKDDVEGAEFGLVLGAGVQVSHFLVEGRWFEGLTNVVKHAENGSYHNRTFAILAGVRFR